MLYAEIVPPTKAGAGAHVRWLVTCRQTASNDSSQITASEGSEEGRQHNDSQARPNPSQEAVQSGDQNCRGRKNKQSQKIRHQDLQQKSGQRDAEIEPQKEPDRPEQRLKDDTHVP